MTTKDDMWDILAVLRAGLPTAYLNLTAADAEAMVNTWAELFEEYPADLVMAASKTYVWNDKTGRFPSPGAIRDEMETIKRVIDQCAYGSTLREYMHGAADRFPPPVQKYMDREYRQKYLESTGRIFTSQAEKAAAYRARMLSAGDMETMAAGMRVKALEGARQ